MGLCISSCVNTHKSWAFAGIPGIFHLHGLSSPASSCGFQETGRVVTLQCYFHLSLLLKGDLHPRTGHGYLIYLYFFIYLFRISLHIRGCNYISLLHNHSIDLRWREYQGAKAGGRHRMLSCELVVSIFADLSYHITTIEQIITSKVSRNSISNPYPSPIPHHTKVDVI